MKSSQRKKERNKDRAGEGRNKNNSYHPCPDHVSATVFRSPFWFCCLHANSQLALGKLDVLKINSPMPSLTSSQTQQCFAQQWCTLHRFSHCYLLPNSSPREVGLRCKASLPLGMEAGLFTPRGFWGIHTAFVSDSTPQNRLYMCIGIQEANLRQKTASSFTELSPGSRPNNRSKSSYRCTML